MSVVRRARLADGRVVDVALDGGRIVAVTPSTVTPAESPSESPSGQDMTPAGQDGTPPGPDDVDADGGLLLPAFVDTHIHLDKVLIRDRLAEHDGTLSGAIGAIHARKLAYTVEDVRRRACAVIESSVLSGTTRLRSHVDVDTIGALVPLQGVQAAAADCADIADVRTIAFPQEGILRDPGTAALLRKAMEAGADVVGGMPHWEDGARAQREHVRFCFDLAQEFDSDLDLHVDETDDGDVRTLAMVVEETERRGWQGRVSVGHVCALSAADEAYAADVVAGCARAGVMVVSNPVTNLVLQGRGDVGLLRRGTTRVRELLAAGVDVAFGQDCVADGFYPFGRGDMLEVALVSAHATHLTTTAELSTVLAAVTTVPARAWHLGSDYGVVPGAVADLQLYAEPGWDDVLRAQDPPLAVWRHGRVVARNTVTRTLRPAPPAP